MNILEIRNSNKEPAFTCNPNGRILDWNAGAERFLGHKSCDMIGRHCFEALDGRDVFGNRFCHERCAIRSMIRRREPINHWQLNFRTSCAERIDVLVSAIVVNGRTAADYLLLHVLKRIGSVGDEFGTDFPHQPDSSLPLSDPAANENAATQLTIREREVLRFLADGASTAEIVGRLSISTDTVRTHIRNILSKLQVHSRLEAVTKAIRRSLL